MIICVRAKYHSSSPWKSWWKISFEAVDMDCKKNVWGGSRISTALRDFVHRVALSFFTNALIIGYLDQTSMMPSKNKSWNCFLSVKIMTAFFLHSAWTAGRHIGEVVSGQPPQWWNPVGVCMDKSLGCDGSLKPLTSSSCSFVLAQYAHQTLFIRKNSILQ